MRFNRKLFLCTVLLCAPAVFGQQDLTKTQPRDDVLRINTELVQTGVTVLDKQGRFVDGLAKEDFELQVEGRPVPISFFENVLAGSARDRLTRTLAREPASEDSTPEIAVRQRIIIFFLDDRHLSLDSIGRTRKSLLNFLNKEMGQNDQVAIASASGQIGFLQQFTDNKEVLRAAVERINHFPYVVTDYGKNPGAPMTEYMALTIERKDDLKVFEFYVQDCLKWALKPVGRAGGTARVQCEVEVKNRARQILIQAGTVTSNTYYSLEMLLRSAEKMPGSKLAFFFSDGFLPDTGPRGPVAIHQIGHLTDQARRAGVVIYTIDARGLISGALDATGNVPFDNGGMLAQASLREIPVTQDALHALAGDTGGRALRNQNYFEKFINEALAETSRYYLIAWRPEADHEKDGKFRKINVSVVGRPDLTVRSARGFRHRPAPVAIANERKLPEKGNRSVEKNPEAELQQALKDSYSSDALPLQLSLIYMDTPSRGTVLTSSVQTSTNVLWYGEEGKDSARLTIAGVVLNDQGKPAASFRTGLTVNPSSTANAGADASKVIYNYPADVKPGIYQVRVAARDDRSGIVGSAMQWIVIPNLASRELSLSSLIVGLETVATNSVGTERIQWSVDKKFAHRSQLRFMTFIYNAVRNEKGGTNLAVRVQVFRAGQAVISKPFINVVPVTDADPARVPFGSEIDLGGLQPGAYVLEVTVQDLVTHQAVSRQITFYVT